MISSKEPVREFLTFINRGFRKIVRISLRQSSSLIHEIEGIKVCTTGKHISPTISRSIYNGSYEQAEIKILKSYLSKEDIVMEIGAGIGLLSAYCAKEIGSNRVFAYEANPKLGDVINKTYQINNVSPTLQICMIGEDTKIQDFYITKDFWSSSFVKPAEEIFETISISMKSFNDEVTKTDPSLLIVDIEGGEHKLFENINLHNIRKIIIELHNSSVGIEKIASVKNKLKDNGFEVVESIPNGEDEILFLRRTEVNKVSFH
jgi:FkbM family methyltransferase